MVFSGRGGRTISSAIALVVAVLTLAGCGGTSNPSTPQSSQTNAYEADREAAVTASLAALTRAQLAGDDERVNQLVDPAATPEFRRSLLTQAAGVRGAGVGSLSYEIRTPTANQLGEQIVPADLQSRLDEEGATDSWVVPTELRYRFAGDTEDATPLSRPLVMARHGDSWSVVQDASTLVGRPAPTPQFWDFPGVRGTRVATAGGTSVVLDYPGSRSVGDRLRAELPAAVGAVTAFWGSRWSRRAIVIATDDADAFAALAGSTGDDTSSAAAAAVSATPDADPAAHQRVVFTPAALTALPGAALNVVTRHELTHVATRSATRPQAPKWITEGVAEYVGRSGTYRTIDEAAPDLVAQVRSGRTPAELPDDADFAIAGPGARVAYETAWSFAAFVAQTWTPTRLRTLYSLIAGPAGATGTVDQATRSVLQTPLPDVLTRWGRWLQDSSR